MKMVKMIATPLILLASSGASANPVINFDNYCPVSTPLECSSQFAQAVQAAQANDAVISLSEGTYYISEFDTLDNNQSFSSLKLKGAGKGKTIIKTREFTSYNIANIEIDGVTFQGTGIHPSNPPVPSVAGTALVYVYVSNNFTFTNSSIIGAENSLMNIRQVQNFSVTGSDFESSGLAGNIDYTNDCVHSQPPSEDNCHNPRPTGVGVGVQDSNGSIIGNSFKKIAKVGVITRGIVTDLTISQNYMDLNLDSPSPRHDGVLVGQAFVYLTQREIKDGQVVVPYNSNVSITNNQFMSDYAINGLRINGDNINVAGNTIRGHGPRAIKAQELVNSRIEHNTIYKTKNGPATVVRGNGIELVAKSSFGIQDIWVTNNTIEDAETSIVSSHIENGSHKNIYVQDNTLVRSITAAITFWSNIKQAGTEIYRNTISNGSTLPFTNWAIYLQNQDNPSLTSNWIYGKAGSINYSHIYLNDSDDAAITYNTINSNNVNRTIGGILLHNSTGYHLSQNNLNGFTIRTTANPTIPLN